MIEQGFSFYFTFVLVLLLLLALSIIIPFYGFFWKRWKGLAIGCVVQPIACLIICLLSAVLISFFQARELRKYREGAMATVSKTDSTGFVHYWYLKADEECFYEYKEKENLKNEYTGFDRGRLYDVVPLDSFRVEVDDKIVVSFDLENQKATATEYGEPIDIINIDWEKVDKYFKTIRNN